jgi:2-oxoglutarate ferredoxin oxidoreductase subunit gamma
MEHAEIKIAGFGGQGVIMAGIVIGKAASIFNDYHATMIQSFGPEARGSACSAQVIVDRTPIAYPYVEKSSILVALNQEAYKLFAPSLRKDGILIYEKDMVTPDPSLSNGVRLYGVQATRIAEELGRVIVQNVVMVGFFAAVTGLLSYDSMADAVRDSIPPGTEGLNLEALKRGYDSGCALLEEEKTAAASR